MPLHQNFVPGLGVIVAVMLLAVLNESITVSFGNLDKFLPLHVKGSFSFALQSYNIFVIYASILAIIYYKYVIFSIKKPRQRLTGMMIAVAVELYC